ncbi:MAG: serine hydrolase domain-containing protein, partial [Myxococcota bacterium]
MYKLIVSALVLSGCAAELHTVRHIPRLMETFEVDGLAVAAVSGDRVLISRGFGVTVNGTEYTATTPCGLFSATKVLASLTYARLAQEGRIDLDAPLRVYLPDAPDAWAEIPFYRLLNHTSGISMVVNTPEFGALAANPQATNEDLYRLVRDAPLDYAPGAYSRYRQSGYAIGELILSGTLGVPFDVLVERYVTKPAGMRHTAHPATTDTTQAPLILSAGGYETTAEDMARLFSGMYHGTVIDAGHWKDVLLTNTYLFGDYSLGSIREIRGGVLTLGHRGGGARANVRYAPDHHVGVM